MQGTEGTEGGQWGTEGTPPPKTKTNSKGQPSVSPTVPFVPTGPCMVSAGCP